MLEEQDTNNYEKMEKKIYEFVMKKWRTPLIGNLLFENNKIVCIVKNPVDYIIDGLLFLNKEKIKSSSVAEDEVKQKVMTKKVDLLLETNKRYINHSFSNFEMLFSYLKKENLFCELSLSKEDKIYLGKVIDVKVDSIDIDFYDTRFQLLDNAYVLYEDITAVTIFSDYADTFGIVING